VNVGRRRHAPAVVLVVLLCAAAAAADAGGADTPSPVPGKRAALRGHDPVAYFTERRPAKGSRRFWFAFDDAVYLFRNARHRDMFAADPERYAPQYDGFCAMMLSRGETGEADPEAWRIVDGKLFVFRSPRGAENFDRDPHAVIERANARWPAVKGRR
jgi:YHS domain-containing protein